MAWMMDTFSTARGHTVLGVVTGKPLALGGSTGRAMATSSGVVHIALAALRTIGLSPSTSTCAVQGFGKVGRGAARLLFDAGLTVLAVSDQYGAIYAHSGLDIAALEDHVDETGSVVGFAGSDTINNKDDLLTWDVDLLVPAAIEGVLHQGNAHKVQAKVIVEGANGPTTTDADAILAAQGCLVVPDILANAGGVVVSYFEWVQANQAYWWSERDIERRLETRMLRAWNQVSSYADEHDVSLREAATALAVHSVVDAHTLRGLYP
jgi:glutamate dehydrogenase (NAD(P)+)